MSSIELAAMVGATALTAANQVSQGFASNAMARHAASVSEGYAAAARDQAAYDEARTREGARRMLGARKAAYGGAGVTLEGTPIDVLGDAATNAEMDALSLRRRGELGAWGHRNGAATSRLRGTAGLRAGLLEGGSTLLTGASRIHW